MEMYPENIVPLERLWEEITSHQGEIFYTNKGLPFTYTVKGGELFCDRRHGRSITRSTFEKAYEKVDEDRTIIGPKRLNMFGAPYVWSILRSIGAVAPRREPDWERIMAERQQRKLEVAARKALEKKEKAEREAAEKRAREEGELSEGGEAEDQGSAKT